MSNAQQPPNTQVTNKPQPVSLRSILEKPAFKTAIAKVLPKHIDAERMTRIAISALTRTPNLAKCTEVSFLRCMMDLSQWGLEPDGYRAHLIPFWNNAHRQFDCTLVIDYKGYVELVERSGTVSFIHCDVVCQNDIFEYNRGQLVEHKIDFKKPRGEIYAAYCLIKKKDGGEKCEVMTVGEIDDIRDRSQGYQAFKNGKIKTTPWESDWEEMAKKTVFKRARKWLTLSAEIQKAEHFEEPPAGTGMIVSQQSMQMNSDDSVDMTDRMIQTASDATEDVHQEIERETPPIDMPPQQSEAQAKELENNKEATTVYLLYLNELEKLSTVEAVGKLISEVRRDIQKNAWSPELKSNTLSNMAAANKKRCEELGGGPRGTKSNVQQELHT